MKYNTSLITGLLALLTSFSIVSALQSKPFYLVIQSDDSSLQGHTLNACHEGAAIEGLCKAEKIANIPKSDKAYEIYRFNSTRSEPNWGVLTFELTGDNFAVSEPMYLYVEPSTNVALPLFEPGVSDETYVSFDSNDLMYIKSFVNDLTSPPSDQKRHLYRWYMCQTYYLGYVYETLAWTLGSYPPENPSCKKVQVKRVFA